VYPLSKNFVGICRLGLKFSIGGRMRLVSKYGIACSHARTPQYAEPIRGHISHLCYPNVLGRTIKSRYPFQTPFFSPPRLSSSLSASILHSSSASPKSLGSLSDHDILLPYRCHSFSPRVECHSQSGGCSPDDGDDEIPSQGDYSPILTM